MTDGYYVRYRNRVWGPLPEAALRAMGERGELTALHFVSRDRTAWTSAADHPDLLVDAPGGAAAPVRSPAGREGIDPFNLPVDPDGALSASLTQTRTLVESAYPPAAAPDGRVEDVVAAGRGERIAAGVLALLLGAFGAHWFYLRRPRRAWRRLAFCWTLAPAALGLVEGVRLLRMDDAAFDCFLRDDGDRAP